MSEKKKVIYVKDLVIKADNVTIEQPKPRRRPYDPFFGGPIREEAVEEEEKYEDVVKDIEDDDKKDDDDDNDDDKKTPFSWI